MNNDNLVKGSTNSITFSHKVRGKEEKEDELINEIIFKKYQINKKCGNTSTIDIYEGTSLENNQPVLILYLLLILFLDSQNHFFLNYFLKAYTNQLKKIYLF